MAVVFLHPLFPLTSPRKFRGRRGLPSILFVDLHSCSRSASGIQELDALL